MSENDSLNQKLAAFGMRLEFWPVSDLLDLVKKTKNPKKHFNKDISAIADSVEDLGFKGAVFIDKDATEIGAGVGRIQAVARNGKYEELPVFRILDLNKAKFKKFRIADNRLPQLSDKWDEEILMADLTEISKNSDIRWLDFEKYNRLLLAEAVQEPATLFEVPEYDDMGDYPSRPAPEQLGSLPPEGLVRSVQGAQAGNDGQVDEDQFAVDFSSANEWGIPDLDPRFQAKALHIPFVKWGEVSYKKPLDSARGEGGTWHFYVDDEKFDRISDNPMPPLMAMPDALVELNYSTYPTQPAALAIGQIFFKRWVSRFWQSKGFNIIVDLNVIPKFSKLNLIGVPEGWRAYATRGSGPMEWLENDWQTALTHSAADEADLLFIVYGGGKEVQAWCGQHHVHWIPERMQIVSGQFSADMDGLAPKVAANEYQDL